MNAAEKKAKFPGAYADYEKAVADKAAIVARLKPLRKEFNAKQEAINAQRAALEPLREEVRKIEIEELVDIDNRLSVLDGLMGGARLSQGTGA